MSFKVLPQMHRLVEQACAEYGVEIAEIIADNEGIREWANGRVTHYPYYIVKLRPNAHGWMMISCRPHKGRYIDYSASQNNVTIVIIPHSSNGEDAFVLPSWRGKLVPESDMDKHTYHIKAGYMSVKAGPDLIELQLIQEYFRDHA